MEHGETKTSLSAFAALMKCQDSDVVECRNADGTVAARGEWFTDRVMGFLLDKPRSRFRFEREGERVTITREEGVK